MGHLVTHPGDALTVGPEVARQSASLIASQPRGYDGLVTPTQDRPLGGAQQWYTPLLSWCTGSPW